MATLTRGAYPVGDAGGVTPNWFPPALDTADPLLGDYTNPFLFGEAQVIGLFDTRPDEAPEQNEVHTAIAWSGAPGGVTLRLNAPFDALLDTDDPLKPFATQYQGGWPPNGSLRLWVGGVDYFHALDRPAQYGGGPLANSLAPQNLPGKVAFPAPVPNGVYVELLRYIQSGSPRFEPFTPDANPRQQRIYETLIASANQYDLSALLGGCTGAPVQIDIAALSGGARYVWIALDFVALPPPELADADAPDDRIRPRWLWVDGFAPTNAKPLFWVPWTTRPGRCVMDIDPPEVRIEVIHELLAPNANTTVADLMYWTDPTRYGVRFTARGCRNRARFHVASNCMYNREGLYPFASLFAVVNDGAGGSFLQDVQHNISAPLNLAQARDPNAQPVAPIWGYLHDTDTADNITAGHVGQVSGVTVSLLGVRPTIGPPFDPFPWGTAPAAIIILGD